MRAWIDTEFSSFDNPLPISFGAVKDNEETMYLEVSPIPENTTFFVKQNILPRLENKSISLSDANEKISNFLAGCVVVFDNRDYDCEAFPILKRFPFEEYAWNENMRCKAADWFSKNKPHHALVDAIGLKIATA